MNELRLGHRVRFRNCGSEPWRYGYFVLKKTIGRFRVIVDGGKDVPYWDICELDPDAKEFLPGDEVKARDKFDEGYARGIYVGCDDGSVFKHGVKIGGREIEWFEQCQYPQEEETEKQPDRISQLERRIEALERKLEELENMVREF